MGLEHVAQVGKGGIYPAAQKQESSYRKYSDQAEDQRVFRQSLAGIRANRGRSALGVHVHVPLSLLPHQCARSSPLDPPIVNLRKIATDPKSISARLLSWRERALASITTRRASHRRFDRVRARHQGTRRSAVEPICLRRQ